MAERTGFEPVEERLAPHRFSKPAHSTTLPSLLFPIFYKSSGVCVNPKDSLSKTNYFSKTAFNLPRLDRAMESPRSAAKLNQ